MYLCFKFSVKQILVQNLKFRTKIHFRTHCFQAKLHFRAYCFQAKRQLKQLKLTVFKQNTTFDPLLSSKTPLSHKKSFSTSLFSHFCTKSHFRSHCCQTKNPLQTLLLNIICFSAANKIGKQKFYDSYFMHELHIFKLIQ